ncbi:GyrI-like domain-containing protein [Flagellimonas pelagia]|uniref:AraC family transcriptional regulator n=2 Tax=Flagellimonas pelagia TaxID=2306998 RepID=A0A3A1NG95_9FLAO|nr:AraC family transcriptional regulator [Allomuricauda maritima]TXJ94051.1 GyrI-like domain-containing protein [Allomuricauda maritima]
MRKILSIIVALFLVSMIWYLFLKPQDYQVSFNARTIPGTIYESVKAWNRTLDSFAPVEFESPTHFTQKIFANDSVHLYDWEITKVHDSLSKVTVNIKDEENSLQNKLDVIFPDNNFEKGSRKRLISFNEFLNDHLKKFKVSGIEQAETFTTFCACVFLKTAPEQKAAGIMANYPFLNSILFENDVKLNGPPFVEVLDWDLKKDSLSYNFCYPIIRSEKLPEHPSITYKRIFQKNALKTIYNGNYITSDRAWYYLLDYAKEHNIPVEEKPIEVFYNNPNMGGDELEWKTEVYIPLKETDE